MDVLFFSVFRDALNLLKVSPDAKLISPDAAPPPSAPSLTVPVAAPAPAAAPPPPPGSRPNVPPLSVPGKPGTPVSCLCQTPKHDL